MDNFFVQNGQFWINDQPQLIQAGEFHYYRTPKAEWPHRLGLLRAAGFNTLATYIPWLWHQLAEDQTDLDGHSHPMRDLGGFLDLAAEMGFLIIARPGPYIMAETINEGIPPWVFANYPQVAFVSQDGKTQNVVSYLHPDFLACVKDWYKAIFSVLAPRQVTHGGKIIMIQLDNEMGMIQWVRNILDTNPDTMTRFAAYLTRTYAAHLADRYPASPLEGFLRDGILHPSAPHAANIVEDYRRFYRDYLREYATWLWNEAKANGMDVPPIVNIHGFGNGGKTFPIGISQLIGVMDLLGMVSATDVYPGHIGEDNIHHMLLVNEMTKALQNKEQPLFSVEFQAGGNQDFGGNQSSLYDLHTRLCISSGMRAINNYLFCDGENDPILSPAKRHDWGHPVRKDGSLRKHYQRYPKLSKVLAVYGSDLICSRLQTVTTIGFLLDTYMTESSNEFTREAVNVITHQRDLILFDMLARGLTLTHRPFDAVEISRSPLDPAQTPLLWVMLEKQCNAATQQKLADYVRAGGKLVLAGRICVEAFDHMPCTILRDALGVTATEDAAPFVWENIDAFGYKDIPVSFVETFAGRFDEVLATRQQGGGVVGFLKKLGKGEALVFGATLPANTLDDVDLVNRMALKMGCAPLFTMSEWADVRLSRGERGSFLFVNNYQDNPLETVIEYGGKPMFDSRPLKLPARRGAILPLDWRLNENVTIHYVTAEITEVADDGSTLLLKTDPAEFFAELTLKGYACAQAASVQESAGLLHITIQSKDGMISLRKEIVF